VHAVITAQLRDRAAPGPFSLEIVQEGLIDRGRDVRDHAADPPVHDPRRGARLRVGLTDPAGDPFTQGNGVTLLLGTLGQSVRASLERFWADGIREGDILLTNDPYGGGGTHLADVSVLVPIFYAGGPAKAPA
jgi:N-methylhydantoinase B